ncbi:MAG: type II secretion system GspH family protein [Saccharofermentans sp.]|nr:type II secretion system GspH family protein [Saccharofermentans sp.]
MIKLNKTKKGFTLIELVLVIAVIVILAGVLVMNISTYLDRAKNGSKEVDEGVSSYKGKVQSLEGQITGYKF